MLCLLPTRRMETWLHRSGLRLDCKRGRTTSLRSVTPGEFVLQLTYDDVNSLHQQNLPHRGLCLRDFDWNRRRSTARASGHFPVSELWMELRFQSPDRWHVCHDPRTEPPLPRLGASRATCPNRTQVTTHRDNRAHFDNSERRAGGDLSIYCELGFGFRLSAPIRSVLDPWSAVANGLAGNALLCLANRLGEIQKSMNVALTKSASGG